jgi:hypothetical protein
MFGLMSAMNSSYKKKLGCSPFHADHGRPMPNMWDIGDEVMEARSEYTAQLLRTMTSCYKTIRMGIAKEGDISKKQYDKKQKDICFNPGEEVAVFFPVGGKTRRQWRAGYEVVSMKSDVNVLIREIKTGKEQQVHVKRVARVSWGPEYEKDKEYKGREPEEWNNDEKNISGIKEQDILIDDLIIFAYKTNLDKAVQYYVGHILEKEGDYYRVHFLKPKKNKRPKEVWQYVFFDAEDGYEIHTNSDKYKYTIYDAWITIQEVLLTRIKLTDKMKLNVKTEEEAQRKLELYRRAPS